MGQQVNTRFSVVSLRILILTALLSAFAAGCRKSSPPDNPSGLSSFSSETSLSSSADPSGDSVVAPDTQVKTPAKVQSGGSTPSESALPAETESPFDSQRVIGTVVQSIGALGTKTVYSENVSNSDTIRLTADKSLSEGQTADYIYDEILDALGYDYYLEFVSPPSGAQPLPELFDYTYALKYSGQTADGKSRVFSLLYKRNTQRYAEGQFDSDAVIAALCDRITAESGGALKRFPGLTGNEHYVWLESAQTWDDTDNAVQHLFETVQGAVLNNNGVSYTQYDIVYIAKADTFYRFLLYLG